MAENGGVNSECESGAIGIVGASDDAGMVRVGPVQTVVISVLLIKRTQILSDWP